MIPTLQSNGIPFDCSVGMAAINRRHAFITIERNLYKMQLLAVWFSRCYEIDDAKPAQKQYIML
jgi:hypothetical protein